MRMRKRKFFLVLSGSLVLQKLEVAQGTQDKIVPSINAMGNMGTIAWWGNKRRCQ